MLYIKKFSLPFNFFHFYLPENNFVLGTDNSCKGSNPNPRGEEREVTYNQTYLQKDSQSDS